MNPSNPYALPQDPATWGLPTSSGIKAILLGMAIGNGFYWAIQYSFSWAWTWAMTLSGVPTQKLYLTMAHSDIYLTVAHAIGVTCMLTGGFWSGRLSRENHLINAGLAGAMITAITVLQIFQPYELDIPDWSLALSIFIPIPCYLLGGLYGKRASLKAAV